MDIGTSVPTYCSPDYLVPARTFRRFARRAEEIGFSGLWANDHLVEPGTYNSNVLDPLMSLSHAAAVTTELPLGTSVLLLPLRRTAAVAARALTLAHLAGRPLTLGLGAGYVPDEFEVAGVPREERGPRLSEAITVLQRLFAGSATFDGRFHSFANVRIDPIPPDPPRLLAGGGVYTDASGARTIPEPVLDRILAAGGWIAPPGNPANLRRDWAIIESHAREAGTDPDDLRLVLLQYAHLVDGDDETVASEQRTAFEDLFPPSVRSFEGYAREHCLTGSLEDVRADLEAYADIGFDEVIVKPATHRPDALDEQLGLMADEVVGWF